MDEEATDATGLEGFAVFSVARRRGDVTRGVPSLADVAAADEVCMRRWPVSLQLAAIIHLSWA